MIKLGVFGLGRGMYYLQQAENAGAQITAICDMDPKKLEDAKKYLAPGGVACTDFEEFLKADMDGAVLCNYYCEHAYFAARCMEKGIAVLSETAQKFFDYITSPDAAEIISAAGAVAANEK